MLKSKILGYILEVSLGQSIFEINMNLENFLGLVMSNIFNCHSSFWAVNEGHTMVLSVMSEGKIHFFLNLNGLSDVDLVAGESSISALESVKVVSTHL
jgi:hypothetical protein